MSILANILGCFIIAKIVTPIFDVEETDVFLWAMMIVMTLEVLFNL